jgi:hypothetical protein
MIITFLNASVETDGIKNMGDVNLTIQSHLSVGINPAGQDALKT